MKKLGKKLLLFSLAGTMMFALAGCGGSGAGENGELNLFIWTEYIPESVIDSFEEETGIKVNMSTYSSNEDMLAKVKSESKGAYDVVVPSDYMVELMSQQDLLEKLDKDQLTNLKNISDAYLKPSYDKDNTYSVPYLGGVAAIAVNTSQVKNKITSYDDLFDPSLKDSIVALDDYRAVIGMTARSMGYSMNETDSAKLSDIETKLLTIKNNISLYDSDSPKSAMISGDATVGYMWSAEIALSMEENSDIDIVYPTEGAYLFMDNLSICKGAKNYDNAMKFINYILDADTMANIASEYPYLMPNKAALKKLGEDYANNKAKNPPAEVIEKGEYVQNLDSDTLAIYDNMWTQLKK
ncbi:MAG: PotD/PotF family extracellular solute-binding protein [Faecalibacillus sp.]